MGSIIIMGPARLTNQAFKKALENTKVFSGPKNQRFFRALRENIEDYIHFVK
jgi:hypothetical protein